VKEVTIHDHPVKLYSLDGGRLWFSNPRDIEKFQGRLYREKVTFQRQFHDYVRPGNGALASVDTDFWR
jgi:hypothetical protein